ncbi:MAG: DUF1549 domain-containing protein [Planctomycetota bacterium]
MARLPRLLFVLVGIAATALAMAGRHSRDPLRQPAPRRSDGRPRDAEFAATVELLNAALRSEWQAAPTAEPADDLTVARRLSLALVGVTPSLEEVRRLEGWPADERIDRHVDRLLADRRAADYLAERLARALVGDENGPFLLFRRRRFVSWIADTLHESSRYDRLIHSVLTGEGVWTDRPEVNFVTATVENATGQPDPDKLAVRVSRAMLGVRLDCAQCHDHPFDERWKQSDFEGLAAFFGATGFSASRFGDGEAALRGVADFAEPYSVEDRSTGKPRVVAPRPPFQAELAGDAGRPRERLAAWVTHPNNRAFARATVNRFWALLVGEPLVEPLDDLPLDAPVAGLDELADAFIASGYDWRQLVRTIAASDFYRLQSRGPDGAIVFPVTRLRGEQVAGAIAQSSQLTTIDSQSHILIKIIRGATQGSFLRRYGDAGSQEMEPAAGAVSQFLLMMNGDAIDERTRPNLVTNAATRIATLAPDDAAAVEAAYLATLTRRPTSAEREHFVRQLAGTEGEPRAQLLGDLYWALINSTEFSWNH